MTVRGGFLAIAMAGHVLIQAQPEQTLPSVFDGYPVPPKTKELLFYIQRNKNENAIVYEARLDANGDLMDKDPVRVNWIRYTEGGVREPINLFENRMAYGVRHDRSKDGVAWMNFVASNKYPFRVEVNDDGQAEARMLISGRYARLDRVKVQAKESGFLPKILYVDICGTEVVSGKEIVERLHP
jgi:hypothetical protein